MQQNTLLLLLCSIFALGLVGIARAAAGGNQLALDSKTNIQTMENDDKVYVVEFFSSMCGSCQEFAPTWKKFVDSNKDSLKFAAANIDTKAGMNFAQKTGALEEGIPNVKIFKGGAPVGIVDGDVVSYKELSKRINTAIKGLSKDAKGFPLRAKSDEL